MGEIKSILIFNLFKIIFFAYIIKHARWKDEKIRKT